MKIKPLILVYIQSTVIVSCPTTKKLFSSFVQRTRLWTICLTYQCFWENMPATFRCYQLKRSKDARKRCINLMSPKYSVIVAENKGFSSRNYLGLFHVDLGLFCLLLQASSYRARFQGSSGHSDSANRPGYEAGIYQQFKDIFKENKQSFGGESRTLTKFVTFKE